MSDAAAPNPLVTILMPTHARAHLVPFAVRSALAQTYAPVEIRVLDNASPDDTAGALAEFRADQRFHYHRHPQDLGITGNWRYGIAAARGEFFCLLHDDDTIEPEFIEKLVAPLRADPTLALAFSDHWTIDRHGRRLAEESAAATHRFGRDRLPGGVIADLARVGLVEHSVPVGATLFRRAAATPEMIDERARGAIDHWLLYQIVKAGWRRAFYLPERLMNYRVHGGGMSTGRGRGGMVAGHLFRYETMLADPAMSPLHEPLRALWAHEATTEGIDLLAAGQRTDARRVLARVLLRQRPPRPRTLAAWALAHLGMPGTWLARRLVV
ncbi:MAG: glycosyltransferase family 2 protein [Verrucomicrobia bacterium]|nr:glycosyltransferase family 2 protein [Verrucomicrobiota bacterium]